MLDRWLSKLHIPSFAAGILVTVVGIAAIEIIVKVMTGEL